VAVWEQCDGCLGEAEIADRVAIPMEVVQRAVAALGERSLLDEATAAPPDYSRREAAGKLARIGGAAALASLIYSVDIGTAAAAAVSHLAAGCAVTSCTGTSCVTPTITGTNTQCNSGICYCSTVNSAGGAQNVLTCGTASGCSTDGTSCATNGSCCGNLCSTAPRRCRSATLSGSSC
jgi:hypothetical protein